MSKKYQVIARKYRPQTFAEVVGQTAAVTTLKNAIRFEKIAHAYLFCGTRGVGKTTLARLFAKALNCSSLTAETEPCGNCPSCLDISSGQSLDVIEIDGASNRGIDDIRQINETVGYAPSRGRYKIYIVDEVHMLTKEAFNALLKTLEEPPPAAKFFFATTEAHKVLPTIISRCQRFDLARISQEQISNKLAEIAVDLNRSVEQPALGLIASFSEGSLRDAESLFDQILCFANETITEEIVRNSLGLVPQELFTALDQAFASYDLSYAFTLVETLFQTGKDLSHFLEQLVEHYRTLTLRRLTASTPSLYTKTQLLHILDLLIQAESSFQRSPFPRITLESILLQIIRSRHRIPIETIVRKLTDTNPELSVSETLEEKTQTESTNNPPSPVAPKVDETPKTAPIPAPKVDETPKAAPIPAPKVDETPKAAPISAPKVDEAPKVAPVPAPKVDETPKAAPISAPKVDEAPKVAPVSTPKVETTFKESKDKKLSLQQAPFNPLKQDPSTLKPEKEELPSGKHPSDYATLLRFASIELDGTIKN